MGLFDHVVPSDRAADLAMVVRRIRKHTDLQVIPMVVVEGRTDEPCFGDLCSVSDKQVFSAGSRDLVEQLLVHLEAQPIKDCTCVYLVDCDGRGKTAHLSGRSELIVTETCDLEADLVKIGVVERLIARHVSEGRAAEIIAEARRTASGLSVVRRAAHRACVSMKQGGLQVALSDLPESAVRAWESGTPDEDAVLTTVAAHLGWSTDERARVETRMADVDRHPDRSLLGKDILDAIYRRVRDEGIADARGWTKDHFYSLVRTELAVEDLPEWEVGRRLERWAQERGLCLIAGADQAEKGA